MSILRIAALCGLALTLSGCLAVAATGAVVGATGAVVGTAAKGVGMAAKGTGKVIGAAIPDGDKKDDGG